MYKHIIWDFDGTLFDTYPVMANVFKSMLEEEGIMEPFDEIIAHMRVSMTYALQYYKEKYRLDDTFIQKYKIRRNEEENNGCKPYIGVEDLCRYIHTSGKHNYLYTHRGETAIKYLKNFGLYDCFQDCITAQHGFERKPSPDAINYLVEKYNMIREEAIMIGDRDVDILSAKNAGIHSCFYTEGIEKSKIADFTINNYEKLLCEF
jgi:HAD superfamily hydrolase (TIGR01549 family)